VFLIVIGLVVAFIASRASSAGKWARGINDAVALHTLPGLQQAQRSVEELKSVNPQLLDQPGVSKAVSALQVARQQYDRDAANVAVGMFPNFVFLDAMNKAVALGFASTTKSVNYLKDNFPGVERVEVEKNQEMFDLLLIGRVDAVVTGRPAAAEFAKAQPGVRLLDKALTTELYGYALRKGDPLIGLMNQALQKLRADGSHAALVTRWFGAAK